MRGRETLSVGENGEKENAPEAMVMKSTEFEDPS